MSIEKKVLLTLAVIFVYSMLSLAGLGLVVPELMRAKSDLAVALGPVLTFVWFVITWLVLKCSYVLIWETSKKKEVVTP